MGEARFKSSAHRSYSERDGWSEWEGNGLLALALSETMFKVKGRWMMKSWKDYVPLKGSKFKKKESQFKKIDCSKIP